MVGNLRSRALPGVRQDVGGGFREAKGMNTVPAGDLLVTKTLQMMLPRRLVTWPKTRFPNLTGWRRGMDLRRRLWPGGVKC
jgi:hypothetical protein